MPKPKRGETRDDFIERCVPIVIDEGKDSDQAYAICSSYFEGNAMSIRVNVKSRVNNKKIRTETRNGREVLILPSATLPDDIVMNGIKYPADVIERSYKTLEKSPAPLGHPVLNGMYISARDPEAINVNWVGAWNENVRREGGRVYLDKVVDVETAKRHPEGQKLLDAVNAQEPINTSTGVLMERVQEEGDGYNWVATEMYFDHDAILLNEQGAANPGDGVGIFVNSEGEQIEVVNSEVPVDFLDMIAEEVVDVWERNERRSKLGALRDRVVSAIQGVLNETRADGLTVNSDDEGDNMPLSEQERKELLEEVSKMQANSQADLKSAVAEAVGEAVKPLEQRLDNFEANQQAAEQRQKDELVQQVVKANLFTEEEAKEMTVNALQAIASKFAKPGAAAPVAGHFAPNASDADDVSKHWDGVDLNANIEQGGGK